MATVYVYSLSDPQTGEVRYLGKTNDLGRRMCQHRLPSSNGHKWHWIQSVLARGLDPVLTVLEEWSTHAEACAAEVRLIAHYRALGAPLTNLTDGGDGARGRRPTPEEVQAHRLRLIGFRHTPEARQRMSIAQNKRYASQDERMKHARPRTPEEREHLRTVFAGRPMPPATYAALRARQSDAEQYSRSMRKAAQTRRANGYRHGPAVLAKIGAKLRGRRASPALRDKLRAAQAVRVAREREQGFKRIISAEGRAAVAASNQRRVWTEEARAKASARCASHNRSEEMRRKTSERMTQVWAERRKQTASR